MVLIMNLYGTIIEISIKKRGNMSEIYQIDNLDRSILKALMENARTPYAELAKTSLLAPELFM